MGFVDYRINLGRNDIFTIVRLPMYEHGITFYIFKCRRLANFY